jgi:ATP-dependent 26S proteasome regulatory subunit
MIIATANEPERLDPALLHRPSRFDRVWKFPLPAMEQRLALLRKCGSAYFSDEVLQEVARESHGFTMAYVQEVVVNALLDCAHQGYVPEDDHLVKSVDALRSQRKSAGKPGESIDERENVGFCGSKNGDR